ncbi:MAG: DUF3987 domain-containing protein [Xanthobacteraceae bacterium]
MNADDRRVHLPIGATVKHTALGMCTVIANNESEVEILLSDGSTKSVSTKFLSPYVPTFDPWQRYVVPAFPLDIFPDAVQEFIVAQSNVIGCDMSGMAMTCLANFSAAIDHRCKLKMMRHGNWYCRPALWVLLVGESSSKKTPMLRAATDELHEIQNRLRETYELVAKQAKDEKDLPPPPPRYVVHDTTIEKLADILSRNPRGVLVERDEIAGWIGQMERYGGTSRGASADRAFWLQAYDGGGYLVDRIKRGEIYVPNLSVSLVGGIQPNRLAELHGLTSDGLLQRFVPVLMEQPRFPKDAPTDSPFSGYAKFTRTLVNAQPKTLVLDDDALERLEDLRRHLHDLELEADGVAEGFQAFAGKLAGVAGSLVLILYMLERSQDSGHQVPLNIVANVARLMREFILPHGFEFYRAAEGATDGDRLQRIASYILTSGKVRFVASDFTSNVAGLRGLSVFDLNKRISPMVAGGWLIPADREVINRAWLINPEVRTRFRLQIRVEELRKQSVAELMGSPRRSRRSDPVD